MSKIKLSKKSYEYQCLKNFYREKSHDLNSRIQNLLLQKKSLQNENNILKQIREKQNKARKKSRNLIQLQESFAEENSEWNTKLTEIKDTFQETDTKNNKLVLTTLRLNDSVKVCETLLENDDQLSQVCIEDMYDSIKKYQQQLQQRTKQINKLNQQIYNINKKYDKKQQQVHHNTNLLNKENERIKEKCLSIQGNIKKLDIQIANNAIYSNRRQPLLCLRAPRKRLEITWKKKEGFEEKIEDWLKQIEIQSVT